MGQHEPSKTYKPPHSATARIHVLAIPTMIQGSFTNHFLIISINDHRDISNLSLLGTGQKSLCQSPGILVAARVSVCACAAKTARPFFMICASMPTAQLSLQFTAGAWLEGAVVFATSHLQQPHTGCMMLDTSTSCAWIWQTQQAQTMTVDRHRLTDLDRLRHSRMSNM